MIVVMKLGVDCVSERRVEVVRTGYVDLYQELAALHLKPADYRLQIVVRDRVFVAQKVGDELEELR